jgi:uncharacterized protein (TIGR02246 family)
LIERRHSAFAQEIKNMNHRIAACSLAIFCYFAAPAWGQDRSKEGLTEIDALLSEHDRALVSQDLAGVLNIFADDAILMGTGPGEEWVGKDAIADAYRHFFADYDAGSMAINCTWQTTGSNGELAWLAAMCWFTDYLKNEKREFAINLSAVAENQGGVWRFRAYHFSNVTAPEPLQPIAP